MGFGPLPANLHSPGPIGDVTPSTIAGTIISATQQYRTSAASGAIILTNPAFPLGATSGIAFSDLGALSIDIMSNGVLHARFGLAGGGLNDTGGNVSVSWYDRTLRNVAQDPMLAWSGTTLTVGSGMAFQLGNAATTGLGAGVLAALTNASIVIKDSTGQSYRVPCII